MWHNICRQFVATSCVLGGFWLSPFVESSFACSCLRIAPPCEAAWLQADAVFLGRIYGSVQLPTKRDGIETLHQLVRVKVLESFIGSAPGWVTVETGAGGSDCGYNFSWGEKYVVYAYRRKDGTLSTSICTRTQKVSDATGDLDYLRSITNLPVTGRVYGTVKQYTFDPAFKAIEVPLSSPYGGPEERLVSMRALTGTRVRLANSVSSRIQTVSAGQNGEFSFEGLAPGMYNISVDLPRLMKPWDSRQVTVPAKGCSQVSIRTAFNGRLSGQVEDEKGAPIPYIAVEVVRARHADTAEHAFRWVTANEDGTFEIGPLPPDEYVIGVNIVKFSGNHERPRTYYPGASNLAAARKIRVNEGQLVAGLNFRLTTPRGADVEIH